MNWSRSALFSLALAAVGVTAACGEDAPNNTPPDALCVANPDRNVVGEEIPISGFEFRNAFDPTDTATYDPDNAVALPGPLFLLQPVKSFAGVHRRR